MQTTFGFQLADLAAGHPTGDGERAGGLVDVLRGLAGHQPYADLVPGRAGAHAEDARDLVAAGPLAGDGAGAAERVDVDDQGVAVVGDGEPAGAQPARHLGA